MNYRKAMLAAFNEAAAEAIAKAGVDTAEDFRIGTVWDAEQETIQVVAKQDPIGDSFEVDPDELEDARSLAHLLDEDHDGHKMMCEWSRLCGPALTDQQAAEIAFEGFLEQAEAHDGSHYARFSGIAAFCLDDARQFYDMYVRDDPDWLGYNVSEVDRAKAASILDDFVQEYAKNSVLAGVTIDEPKINDEPWKIRAVGTEGLELTIVGPDGDAMELGFTMDFDGKSAEEIVEAAHQFAMTRA